MEFIEFRLFWEGGINCADIVEQFGVSVLQAPKDLTLYEEKVQGNLVYDKSAKRYKVADSFKSVFMQPSAFTCLAHLRVEADVLRDVLKAVRGGRSIGIFYQSMSAKKLTLEWRWISFHALGNDGLRWCIRAFCYIARRFRDFILSRCMKTRKHGLSGTSANDDKLWYDRFAVAPNLALCAKQRSIVTQDYEMTNGRTEVMVRKALLYYCLKRLRSDVADKLDTSHKVPVVVANRTAFDAALAEAMA